MHNRPAYFGTVVDNRAKPVYKDAAGQLRFNFRKKKFFYVIDRFGFVLLPVPTPMFCLRLRQINENQDKGEAEKEIMLAFAMCFHYSVICATGNESTT